MIQPVPSRRPSPAGRDGLRIKLKYNHKQKIMFNSDDLRQIESRGSSAAAVEQQIERFKNGFPWMKISAPATPGKGIAVLDAKAEEDAVKYYESAKVDGKCKFVPASGAASRMFKDLFAGLDALREGKGLAEGAPARRFVENIGKFAFYDSALYGEQSGTDAYMESVLDKTLNCEPLGYGAKPKGVIKFHRYAEEVRTAFEEHLVEAQEYMRNPDGSANVVVTISPEHEHLFREVLESVKEKYEKRYGVKYNVTFTYQDKATDTVAVDVNNNPFRTETDSLLFRPAGHGALINNLNALSEELVSIKNIDNVAHDRYLPATARYKKVLMGKCLEIRDRIHGYLRELDAVTENYISYPEPYLPGYSPVGKDEVYLKPECQLLCNDIQEFLEKELCISLPESEDCKSRVMMIRRKLDRPIRVCGMVKNEGEPGGGPFIISEKDGTTSLQILESVQINMADETARKALSEATHFNPVDIVCCLHDYRGRSFDLQKYVDHEAGFISSKSYQGRELKALELPGLWNGSMSDWNTLFVEVPSETFNPVKTVLDLLRPAHQPESRK